MTAREIAAIRKQYESIKADRPSMSPEMDDFREMHFEPMLSALERLTAPVTEEEALQAYWDYDTNPSDHAYEAEQHSIQKFIDNRLAAEKEKHRFNPLTDRELMVAASCPEFSVRDAWTCQDCGEAEEHDNHIKEQRLI